MRIFISADLEGISGVVAADDVSTGKSTVYADRAVCIPAVRRTGARSIACTLGSMPEATRFLSVLVCVRE